MTVDIIIVNLSKVVHKRNSERKLTIFSGTMVKDLNCRLKGRFLAYLGALLSLYCRQYSHQASQTISHLGSSLLLRNFEGEDLHLMIGETPLGTYLMFSNIYALSSIEF